MVFGLTLLYLDGFYKSQRSTDHQKLRQGSSPQSQDQTWDGEPCEPGLASPAIDAMPETQNTGAG